MTMIWLMIFYSTCNDVHYTTHLYLLTFYFLYLIFTEDVPAAPRDLRVLSEGSRSATVTWAAPSSPNTPITSYILQLRDAYGKNFIII